MTPGQWQQVRDLFEQAIELPPADIADWLDRQQAAPEVAAEVRSLLHHHTEAGEFLSEPIAVRSPALLEEDPLTPGTVIGAYTVVREIGRGGMGRVYEGRDERLGRSVALKTLPGGLAGDPARRERLRREARAAALLTHPGICTVHALEERDDTLVVVTELIDGESLRDEIASGRRPSPADVEDTMRQLVSAVAHAHANGITHRDLKPENIMRTRDGRLKILDFGLALFDDGAAGPDGPATRITQPGAFIGTPGYMAPEQLTNGTADPRSDVFAIGVVVYEFSSGVHPFAASTPIALAARVLEAAPRPLYTLRPDLDPSIVNAVARALDKNPDVRFQHAGEMMLALAGPGSPPGPIPGATGRSATWWRTHQLAVLALYIVAVTAGWQIKEWRHGATDTAFLALGVLAAVAGMFRGHLLFTEQQNRPAFAGERRRAAPLTGAVDLLMAGVLAVDGWMAAAERPLVAVLTIALAIGIAMARLVVERSTTQAAFGEG